MEEFDPTDTDLHMEKEHVFPKSWYPTSTSPKIQRLTVPAHRKCNREIAKVEEELFIRLALITVPGVEGAVGLRERALRAIDPDQASSVKDRQCRASLRERILADVIPDLSWYPKSNLVPNYQVPLRPGDSCSAIRVKPELVDRFIGKLVRGIIFHEEGLFLDQSWRITVKLLDENEPESIDMEAFMTRFISVRTTFGPGIRVDRHITEEDRRMSVFKIDIWQHFIFRAVVIPAE